MATAEEAEPTTKADEIMHRLEELIVGGSFAPGTVLRQDELARRFDVSRTPIREALRQLAALGLVSFTPNRGVRVLALDRNDWAETYRARAALEGAATEIAVQRMAPEAMTEILRAHDEFTLQSMRLRDPGLDEDQRAEASYAWVAANEWFHGAIIQSAEMPVFDRLIKGLRRVFSGEANWSPGSAADRLYEADLRHHDAIVAAIAAGNPVAARQLMETHILESWDLLAGVLDEVEIA
ncbi:MAG: GntR family transcriptional regulator [Marmoricola sp.]|nr:GntR family transcriptional regulator [Marmoricola sp.]